MSKKTPPNLGVVINLEQRPDPNVESLLYMSKDGTEPRACLANVDTIFNNDPRWAGRIRHNSFEQRAYIGDRPMEEHDVDSAATWIGHTYGLHLQSDRMVEKKFKSMALSNKHHPVREYLRELEWDGKERLSGLLHRYFLAEDSKLNRALSRCFLISAVARAIGSEAKPVQVDTVLILKGPQGCFKSSALRILAGDDWFSATPVNMSSKDGLIALQGVWIQEVGELDSFSQNKWTKIKDFISQREDKFRAVFGRWDSRYPRQLIFVGTTNEDEFLGDPTGARRWWPVDVAPEGGEEKPPELNIDIARLSRDRDQLWAEAMAAYSAGEKWHLPLEMVRDLKAAQARYKIHDAWEEAILLWLKADPRRRSMKVSSRMVLKEAIGMKDESITKSNGDRVGGILRGLGYIRLNSCRINGVTTSGWRPPPGGVEALRDSELPTEDDEF